MWCVRQLALPLFWLLRGELGAGVSRWALSEPVVIGGVSLGPSMWLLLLANVFTQWACVRSVYMLTSSSGTLTCTVVLTLRKFLSLLLSVWHFENVWTDTHWAGSALVFTGVILYSWGSSGAGSSKEEAAAGAENANAKKKKVQ